ncbi:MAG: hypothetical protein ACFBSD_10925 [Paracoccaceae bacterium]
MIRAACLAAAVALLVAPPALAHRLLVFAFVESGTVVVESKFSNGRIPAEGTVIVFDGTDAELSRHPLGADGTLRFPLDERGRETGLKIEVSTGRSHSDYWILTPEDIAGADAN